MLSDSRHVFEIQKFLHTAASRRKRTEAVALMLVRRGAEADPAGLGERFEEVRFVPEMERFLYRRRRRAGSQRPTRTGLPRLLR